MNTKGIELNKIRPQYKFTINQEKEIIQARDWMLAKYKNVKVSENVEMVRGKPQIMITLISNE